MSKKLFIVLTLAIAFITIIFVSISQKYHRKQKVPLYMKEINAEDVYIDEDLSKITLKTVVGSIYAEELKENSDYHFKKYLVESMPKEDYNKLVNLASFDFTTIGKQCIRSTFILILIFSPAGNAKARNTIRKSWAQNNKNVTTIFVIGSTKNKILQNAIIKENHLNQDIIQGSIIDSEKNYIYKYVMALKYSVYFCPQAHYVIKTNDDIYINVPVLKKFLVRKFKECGSTDLIQCSTVVDKTKNPNEETVHKKSSSNLYCLNHAVIFSWDVVFRLYQLAQERMFHGNREAFITGKLAGEFNIQHKDIKNYTIDFNMLDEIIFSHGIKGKKHFIFGPRDLDLHLMKYLWDVIGHIDTSDVVLPNEEC